MNYFFSKYLDLIRVSSAIIVLLSHLGHGHLIGGILWPFTYFGNEAVMAFFVLSGFVIAYVADQREKTLTDYTVARIARLFSVILPAMILTLLFDSIGYAINPTSYHHTFAPENGNTPIGYFLSLFMLNQSWNINQHFGSNGAYWSLPYEFWYYVLFGAFIFLSGWIRISIIALGIVISGPKILQLLPVWLLGVAVYHLLQKKRFVFLKNLQLLLALLSFILLSCLLWYEYKTQATTEFFGIKPNSLTWQYLTGFCVAVHIYGMEVYATKLSWFLKLINRPLHYLSQSTLSLYLFHLPVIALIISISNYYGKNFLTTISLLIIPFAISLTFGRYCELKKNTYRTNIMRLFAKLSLNK